MVEKSGKLFVVSTPIGNKDDITYRAVNVLAACDLVVCEETKEGAVTLRNINLKKELIELNEQNEVDKVPEIIEMIKSGKKIALISDAGTPVFADPGFHLVNSCLFHNLNIEVVPGVTSIMAALVRSGFSINEFLFAGFLDRKEGERLNKLQMLAKENRTVVFLETPYRLNAILSSASKVMPNRKAYIGMNLTLPFETHHYGTFSELNTKFENEKVKAEFVVVFEASGVSPKQYASESFGEKVREKYNKFEDKSSRKFESKRYSNDKPSKSKDRFSGFEENESIDDDDFNTLHFSEDDSDFNERNEGSERTERRNFRDNDRNSDRRNNFGNNRKPDFREKKNFGDRPDFREKRNFGDRPDFREKRNFGDRPDFREKKNFGDRPDFREKKNFGDRPDFREKRNFGDKPDFREKRNFGDKPDFREKRSFGDKPDFREKRNFGDKPDFREKRSFGDKPDFREKRSFGDKPDFREKRSFGDKPDFKKSSGGRSNDFKKKFSNESGNRNFKKSSSGRSGGKRRG